MTSHTHRVAGDAFLRHGAPCRLDLGAHARLGNPPLKQPSLSYPSRSLPPTMEPAYATYCLLDPWPRRPQRGAVTKKRRNTARSQTCPRCRANKVRGVVQ